MKYKVTVECIEPSPEEGKYPSREILFEQKFDYLDIQALAIVLNKKNGIEENVERVVVK